MLFCGRRPRIMTSSWRRLIMLWSMPHTSSTAHWNSPTGESSAWLLLLDVVGWLWRLEEGLGRQRHS